MPLIVGTRLGHYQLGEMLGKGGMGEVYRATDTRLGRQVAIKVSAEQFTERFEREARMIGSLNHPNICTLHDVGPNYLVMELVEGESPRGPLPLEEALRIAKQIAEALSAAHDKGIVHRDLKPGNIKIKADGTVKVLDFGLAKVSSVSALSPVDAENSPTISIAATQAGVILGTAAYMSPEQARGKPVDKRADIWAFGVVLYEMLTGKRLFQGETTTDILAAVVRQEPDWNGIPAPALRLVQSCLQKVPEQRLHDIADAKLLLDGDVQAESMRLAGRARPRMAWVAAGVFLAAAAVVSVVHFREKPPPVPGQMRLQIALPSGSNVIALSPDGRRLAYAGAGPDGRTALWVREMSTLEPRRMTGSEGIETPFFWSPDSRFLVFQEEGKLKKVDASGGPPQVLCDAPRAVIGGSWNRDGVIIFGYPSDAAPGIRKLLRPGGTPVLITNQTDLFPSFLPDGRHFIYLRAGTPDVSGIYLGSIDAKIEEPSTRRLLAAPFGAQYVPTEDPARGYILFLRDGTLMAQTFDASHLQLGGEPVPVAERVGNFLLSALFSASENGILAYRGGTGSVRRLSWFDRQGNPKGFAGEPANYNDVTLSHDGTRAATSRLDIASTNIDIWVQEFARQTNSRLTTDPGLDLSPVWSPKGDRIAFNRGVLYQKPSSGGPEQVLLPRAAYPNDWSNDGGFLLYMERDPKTQFDLWALPLTGDPNPMIVVNTQFNERAGQFSPDVHWIAYVSDESGIPEVYVQPFPPSPGSRRQQISQGGGDQPRWRGKELFFLTPDGSVMAVDLSPGAARVPNRLFQVPLVQAQLAGESAFHWDVTPDGKKFLIDTSAEGAAAPATVVLNWMAGLSRN